MAAAAADLTPMGGTFDPHEYIENLHAPALMVCGEAGGDGLLMGDVASPNCEIDFLNATVPGHW